MEKTYTLAEAVKYLAKMAENEKITVIDGVHTFEIKCYVCGGYKVRDYAITCMDRGYINGTLPDEKPRITKKFVSGKISAARKALTDTSWIYHNSLDIRELELFFKKIKGVI